MAMRRVPASHRSLSHRRYRFQGNDRIDGPIIIYSDGLQATDPLYNAAKKKKKKANLQATPIFRVTNNDLVWAKRFLR